LQGGTHTFAVRGRSIRIGLKRQADDRVGDGELVRSRLGSQIEGRTGEIVVGEE